MIIQQKVPLSKKLAYTYPLTDKNSEIYALEDVICFTITIFLTKWANQYAEGVSPQSDELPLNQYTVAWLSSLFHKNKEYLR
ncbi:hypothetical protein [Candidatus Paracaedibacter symbiosus]|uniref:hypothetical protein n=1 Tax=Candidatus Paracaedibacter symbiosus TaxID=244582 RepID=UPI0005094D71|nr:hypothetical protein [Candidatus Paracaedibacter symbiosus]